jgi:rhodanese-related sulfurtransferase
MNPKPAFAGAALSLGLFAWVLMLIPARAEERKALAASEARHVDANAAAQLLATNQVIVLDIRTPREFAAGHIAGATNINSLSGDFNDKLAQLDRSKSYLLHCAVGGRSTNALPKLVRLGFTNVIHLDGGFKAWQAAGNPVARP